MQVIRRIVRKTALVAVRFAAALLFIPCVALNALFTWNSNRVMFLWMDFYECRSLDDSYPQGYWDLSYDD